MNERFKKNENNFHYKDDQVFKRSEALYYLSHRIIDNGYSNEKL